MTLEEMKAEDIKNAAKTYARRLLRSGKIQVNELTDYFPNLTDRDVLDLESEMRRTTT